MRIEKSTKVRKRFWIPLVMVVYVTSALLSYNIGATDTLDIISTMCKEFNGFIIDDQTYQCKTIIKGIQS